MNAGKTKYSERVHLEVKCTGVERCHCRSIPALLQQGPVADTGVLEV